LWKVQSAGAQGTVTQRFKGGFRADGKQALRIAQVLAGGQARGSFDPWMKVMQPRSDRLHPPGAIQAEMAFRFILMAATGKPSWWNSVGVLSWAV